MAVAGCAVPADFSLCDLKPAPSASAIPETELTAALARERLDAEYARLRETAPAAAREFAVDSFSTARLPAGSPHYVPLAIEMEYTWKIDGDFYSAKDLALAYGSALGALARAEAAARAGQ